MSKNLVPEDRTQPGSNYRTYPENGREYGRQYRYMFPCDQLEMDKLDILHNTISIATERRVYTAPVHFRSAKEETGAGTNGAPRRAGRQVLDLGTGTGLWATAMAEEYPDAQVFAVDLFDFQQPNQIFSNTWFSGHIDIEKPWDWLTAFVAWAVDRRQGEGLRDFTLFPNGWDLIYARMLNGSIRDRKQLYRRMFDHLTPGLGYIELVEIDWTPRYDDNTAPKDSRFARWTNELYKAMEKEGRDMRVDPKTSDVLRELGYVDVREQTFKLYHNPWITGGTPEDIGRWFNLSLTHGLQGMSMAPFTRHLNWTPAEVNKLVDEVRHEICLLRHHGYCTLAVISGQQDARPIETRGPSPLRPKPQSPML